MPRKTLTGIVAAAALSASSLVLPVVAGAETEQDRRAAERAADQIAAAQGEADAAAAAWADAQSEYDTLADELVDLEGELAASQAKVDGLRGSAFQVALDRYMRPDVGVLPFASSAADASEQLQADAFAAYISRGSTEAYDEYAAATADLAADKEAVIGAQEDTAAALANLEQRQADLAERIADLQEAEAERQVEVAAREAREAQQAQEAAAAAAAAAASQSQSGGSGGGQQAAGAASGAAGSDGGGGQTQQDASSGDGDGDSGESSTGGERPDDGGAAVTQGPDIVCPVAGPVTFTDTWGAPRSGGRTHKGVDMLGARGTPLVAVVSGSVRQSTSGLGGRQVWLTGNDGNAYFYAHLDSYEGGGGGVSAGDVVGYLGDTGNARGTPHLHFEFHPGGGSAVNPTPLVSANC